MTADVTAQILTLYRGGDAVIPFTPAAPTPAPAALAFTAAAAPEGEPLFAELTVGAGITVTDAEAGAFTVAVPRAVTGAVPAGDYVWSLWDLDDPRAPLAAGALRVVATARRPGI
jgi:hypothetical protein